MNNNIVPVYIDIDGVMQSNQSVLVSGAPVAHMDDPRKLLNSASPMAVELLLRVQRIHCPEMRWFIASTWCNATDKHDELRETFNELGFRDVTLCVGRDRVQRIRDSLATLPEGARTRAIILDDSTAFRNTELERYWLHIDSLNGVTGVEYYAMLRRIHAPNAEIFMW